MIALPHRVTWQEPTTAEDRYSNAVDTFTEPARGWPVIDAWIQQQSTTEQRDARDTVSSTWTLLTNELDVTAKARIGWEGMTFQVDGDPHVVSNRRGPHHLEARLLRVVG